VFPQLPCPVYGITVAFRLVKQQLTGALPARVGALMDGDASKRVSPCPGLRVIGLIALAASGGFAAVAAFELSKGGWSADEIAGVFVGAVMVAVAVVCTTVSTHIIRGMRVAEQHIFEQGYGMGYEAGAADHAREIAEERRALIRLMPGR